MGGEETAAVFGEPEAAPSFMLVRVNDCGRFLEAEHRFGMQVHVLAGDTAASHSKTVVFANSLAASAASF